MKKLTIWTTMFALSVLSMTGCGYIEAGIGEVEGGASKGLNVLRIIKKAYTIIPDIFDLGDWWMIIAILAIFILLARLPQVRKMAHWFVYIYVCWAILLARLACALLKPLSELPKKISGALDTTTGKAGYTIREILIGIPGCFLMANLPLVIPTIIVMEDKGFQATGEVPAWFHLCTNGYTILGWIAVLILLIMVVDHLAGGKEKGKAVRGRFYGWVKYGLFVATHWRRPDKWRCPACGASNAKGEKYCTCGQLNPDAPWDCEGRKGKKVCGKKDIPAKHKVCPICGHPRPSEYDKEPPPPKAKIVKCSNCGADHDLSQGEKCSHCGKPARKSFWGGGKNKPVKTGLVCPRCGRKDEDDGTPYYCEECGIPLQPQAAPASPSTPSKPRKDLFDKVLKQ